MDSNDSTAAKGCFWEMTRTGSITRYHLFFLIEDTIGYVESVVVEKLIWSYIVNDWFPWQPPKNEAVGKSTLFWLYLCYRLT